MKIAKIMMFAYGTPKKNLSKQLNNVGSLARIPMGMLTDRFGGRLIFTILMLMAAASVASRAYERCLARR